jgi:hypothetical protein
MIPHQHAEAMRSISLLRLRCLTAVPLPRVLLARRTRGASCSTPSSGNGILTAKARTVIGAKTCIETLAVERSKRLKIGKKRGLAPGCLLCPG